MTLHPITHGTLTLERTYDAAPEDVFNAWADAKLKARWFVGPDGWTLTKRELDFRVGGREILHGKFTPGPDTLFTAWYHDIVPDTRIVYAYDMHLDGTYHSASLATVEFQPVSEGTRLVFTEQVAFLDGTDGTQGTLSRERGSGGLLDQLGAFLEAAGVTVGAPRRQPR
jgi:uncharacterized protein YndB with AHSA1/START domain